MGKAVTYKSREFAAKVIHDRATNKKRLALNAPTYYQSEINKFKIGDPVTIILTNKKPKRTIAQNNYWWGVYLPKIIEEDKGAGSPEDTHEDIARKFLTAREWRNSRGQLCYIRKSTSELSVGEFNQFTIDAQDETGVVAPPTENYGLAPLKSK